MKVIVIDNTEQLAARLSGAHAEVFAFEDEIQALNAVEGQQPEMIFLNHDMYGDQTPEYIRLLLSVSDTSKLVVIGENVGEDDILLCLLVGAQGYQDVKQLPGCINKLMRVVLDGEAWVSRKMVARVLDALRQRNSEALIA